MGNRVAIIEAKPSRNDYVRQFLNAFEFDRYSLTSDESLKKVLKKDVDIKIDLEKYDWIILIGSEPLKYFTKITSITEYSGRVVDGKFLPVINPAMLVFKPEVKKLWEESRSNIIDLVTGRTEVFVADESRFIGITEKEEAKEYLLDVLNSNTLYVAVDTETTALYPRDGYVLGISISYEEDSGAYISSDCVDEELEELFQEIFDSKIVIFHNAKFDIAMLEFHFGFRFPRFEDTMLQHYMLNEQPGTHGLKQLALKYTKYGDYEKELYDWMDQFRKEHRILKGDFKWEWIPFDVMKTYASKDAGVTFILFFFFKSYLDKNDRLMGVYKDILLPGVRFLIDVQDNGVPFDRQRLVDALNSLTVEIEIATKQLRSLKPVRDLEEAQEADFNPNSVLQLRRLLFDYVGLQPTGKKTAKGADSTDAEVLKQLASQHPIPKLILEIRHKGKIKNTYLEKILPQLNKDNHLRTNFNLHGTTSGRLSSSGKLNMQQIPRDDPIVKGCIKAPPGKKIVAVDLTTAEMYVAAVLSGDEALQDVFRSKGDFHSTIAHRVFKLPCTVEEVKELYPKERQAAKAISFGILYGAGPHKIMQEIRKDGGSMTMYEAEQTINDYFKAFPKLKKWIDRNISFIKTNAFAYSAFGRKRRLPNVKAEDSGIQGHEIRSGLNFLVQSVASDINLIGGIEANERIKQEGVDAKIFALVHDSILAEVSEDEVDDYIQLVTDCLEKDRGVSIPGCPIGLDFEIGDDYSMGKFEEKYLADAA